VRSYVSANLSVASQDPRQLTFANQFLPYLIARSSKQVIVKQRMRFFFDFVLFSVLYFSVVFYFKDITNYARTGLAIRILSVA
jgi:hypothetical protein